jgi:hypothetical protein
MSLLKNNFICFKFHGESDLWTHTWKFSTNTNILFQLRPLKGYTLLLYITPFLSSGRAAKHSPLSVTCYHLNSQNCLVYEHMSPFCIVVYGHMFLIHQMITRISVLFNLHTDNRHINTIQYNTIQYNTIQYILLYCKKHMTIARVISRSKS